MNADSYRTQQKRDRLMREIREAHTVLLWHLVTETPQGKRARTLAARRLAESSKDLWKLLAGL
jgi:hypothetical protein